MKLISVYDEGNQHCVMNIIRWNGKPITEYYATSMMLFKGKHDHELTPREAVDAARHFHAAHLESYAVACKAERRMRHMQEALTPDEIKQLDRWLADHDINQQDCVKGDGQPYYQNWRLYK